MCICHICSYTTTLFYIKLKQLVWHNPQLFRRLSSLQLNFKPFLILLFEYLWCDLRNHGISRWAKFSGTSKNRKNMKNSPKNVYWNFQWISAYSFTSTQTFHRKVSFCTFLGLRREIKSIFGNHRISRNDVSSELWDVFNQSWFGFLRVWQSFFFHYLNIRFGWKLILRRFFFLPNFQLVFSQHFTFSPSRLTFANFKTLYGSEFWVDWLQIWTKMFGRE